MKERDSLKNMLKWIHLMITKNVKKQAKNSFERIKNGISITTYILHYFRQKTKNVFTEQSQIYERIIALQFDHLQSLDYLY